MSGHMKRILRHTLVYGLGFVGHERTGAVAHEPLYTRYIPPEGYGRLRLVSITLQILTIVGSLGVGGSLLPLFLSTRRRR